MKNVTITVKENVNVEQLFDVLTSIGITNAGLYGNEIKGSVADNLVGPLRSVEGVENVVVEGGDPAPEIPKENPNVPQLEPEPQPAPSKVDAPAVTKWSGVEEN